MCQIYKNLFERKKEIEISIKFINSNDNLY